MIVVVMGVSGSGKTTVGRLVAQRAGWQFAEGDDYHSEANKQKMRSGIALNDEDRAPWLAALHDVLLGWHRSGAGGVLACSALKQSYRDTLAEGIPPGEILFALLTGPRELLAERLGHRAGHYMNPDLLDSQLATLEDPKDALHVSIAQTPEQSAEQILSSAGIGSEKS